MPSSRRVKLLMITVGLIVLSVLYLTSSARRSNAEFYDRTVAAMERAAAAKVDAAKLDSQPPSQAQGPVAQAPLGPDNKDEDVDSPLARPGKSEAQDEVPANAGSREPIPEVKKPPSSPADAVAGGGADSKSEAKDGKGPKVGEGKKWDTGSGGTGKDGIAEGKKEEKEEKSEEERKVEAELNGILKRSPIIIFSKSYCPYSKKAKAVFSKYSITPAPFIVELDQHEMGPALQAALGKATQRKTVPNILIGGVSVGGGDEVVAMDAAGELEGKIKSLGGKRIMEVKKTG